MGNKFVINGLYNPGGQERVLKEMLPYLDKMVEADDVQLALPKKMKWDINLNNIKIVRFGISNKVIWTQIYFFLYTIRTRRIGINMFNACPIIKPDIIVIHDLIPVLYKELFNNLHGKLSYYYGELCRISAKKFGKLILTLSENSKKDIIKIYNIEESRICILGCGWQHMDSIQETEDIFKKYPMLKKGEYYLSVSSLSPQKNFKWVKNVAKTNEDSIFAIVGSKVATSDKEYNSNNTKNLFYLGRISDNDMKALMINCKAFIHPAIYEGFGIPPLEAMAVGAKVIVSKASCLPEIFEDAAYYIDPYNYEINLEELLKNPVVNSAKVLEKYSWQKVARNLYESLQLV